MGMKFGGDVEWTMLMKIDDSKFELTAVRLRMQTVASSRPFELPLKSLTMKDRVEAVELSRWAHSR